MCWTDVGRLESPRRPPYERVASTAARAAHNHGITHLLTQQRDRFLKTHTPDQGDDAHCPRSTESCRTWKSQRHGFVHCMCRTIAQPSVASAGGIHEVIHLVATRVADVTGWRRRIHRGCCIPGSRRRSLLPRLAPRCRPYPRGCSPPPRTADTRCPQRNLRRLGARTLGLRRWQKKVRHARQHINRHADEVKR